jgi:hypothetical protein
MEPGSASGPVLRRWWVDPGGGWFGWWGRRLVDEALRVIAERLIERGLARGMNGIGLAVMHLVRGHQADPGMMMVLVVPMEEAAAETSGILDAAKSLGEGRLILQSLEVTFGERVVLGGVRSIVRSGYAEVSEQQRGGLGLHRSTAIGMQSKLTARHVMPGDGVVEQRLEQRGALCIGDAPANHAATEDVEDDVEIEVTPFGWPHQLGDIPGPDLVRPVGQQSGLPLDRMAQLLAAFADFAVLAEDAVHSTDRAMVDTFIEQGGIDLGRRLVGEARRMQQIQHHLVLWDTQRPCGSRPWAADRRRRGQPDAPAPHAGT